jgi:hypothetical protein
MRGARWPHHSAAEHEAEMERWLARPDAMARVPMPTDAGPARWRFSKAGTSSPTSAAPASGGLSSRRWAHERLGFVEVERAVRYPKAMTG